MAKTLAKANSLNHNKISKLRVELDFYRSELESVDEQYEAALDRELGKFLVRANKQLEKVAFLACDKEEYAQSILEEKLQKYDVKAYMEHRRVNHTAAKAIYKAVAGGLPIQDILNKNKQYHVALAEKRERFIASLEAKKANFLAKHNVTDPLPYKELSSKLEVEYAAKKQELEEKLGKKRDAKKASLQGKIEKIEAQTSELLKMNDGNLTLPDDVLLRVRGLKMYFGGLKAVDNLDFDVKKGEIFGLIGPNGAGKTTVFNCITRFYDATGGEMYFENKHGEVVDLRSFKVHDIILQGIGRTFQNIELVKEISVLDNLLIAATRSFKTGFVGHVFSIPTLKREEKLLRAKAMRILKFMGLENYAQWWAMGLPYGILKKVEIARALMADAKLIIMDEPAAGLNDSETAELTETIRKIRDEFGVTILLVEHDMGLVMNVCDTVCAISFGQMLGIGTTEEIQKNKAVQEAYLGVAEEE